MAACKNPAVNPAIGPNCPAIGANPTAKSAAIWIPGVVGKYCVTKLDKNTLKTAEWNKLGRRASTGCIRMNVADAKWIYDYVAAYSYVYTIQGTPDPELWAALKLPDLPLDVTRDPTDVF